jgi:hypothetical protein
VSHLTCPRRALASRRSRRRRHDRRAVASVLAMMFLVLFGSLAAAMAVVAHSNMRTADSGLKVNRAMSAAETGLVFAQRTLARDSARFVVTKGVVDADFGEKLWMGTYSNGSGSDGTVTILDPDGYTEATTPTGIIDAVANAHSAEQHSLYIPGDVIEPTIDTTFGILHVPPIALTTSGADGPFFRLRYELLSDVPMVRVTSEGVDGDVTRTLQMDIRLSKKIEFAVLSPNRIMIGKNVRVEGPLGSRYGLVPGELDPDNGDPLVLRSDFYYLDTPGLDAKLDTFFNMVSDFDVDGDGRLRPEHPQESLGLTTAFLVDVNGDEYVDDFDLFLGHYDVNGDGMVVYSAALAAAAGHGALGEEFADVDNQLARLIDEAVQDRDGDGEFTASDTLLGYRDGVLDVNDLYAKVHGRVGFSIDRASWEAAHGSSYQTVVHGPVRMEIDEAPVTFQMSDEEMLEITTAMFDDSQTWYAGQGTGDFNAQAVAQDGVGTAEIVPVDAATPWESVPFEAPGAYDYYQRTAYRNMTFTNVLIPMGTNALFENCIFVGVTFIETTVDCDHHDWNYAGAVEPVEDPVTGDITYELRFPDVPSPEDIAAGDIVADTRTISNNLRFDNCTVLGSLSGSKPNEYAHWRNKVQFTGNTRFYIDPMDPDLLTQADAAALQSLLNALPSANRDEMAKSSILMPGWSIDVGNFTNQQDVDPTLTPKVKLKGTIIAGILDVRGTADVFGTLLMTFRPTLGQGPLYYGGLPDVFNTTIGYFDESAGGMEGGALADIIAQGFGEITLRYDRDTKLPDGIPWPVRMDPEPGTYVEGGAP